MTRTIAFNKRIDSDTLSFGVGPLSLDVEMARYHGWAEWQIEKVAEEISRLSREHFNLAERARRAAE